MNEDVVVGGNSLPLDVQIKLGEFLDWVDEKYTFKNGKTAMFWYLSGLIDDGIEKDKL